MFLLYLSKGCNICELVLHECYINDLYTTTCSGMLGHHNVILKCLSRSRFVVSRNSGGFVSIFD
jgi:hypothetical protein